MAGKFGSMIHQARQAIGKLYGRTHSDKSTKALISSLRTITDHLKASGLERIENIKPHMVLSFFEARQVAGISLSQLGKDATAFRLLAEKVGKPNIIPRSNRELGFSRSKADRMQPKTLNHSAATGIRANLVERFENTGHAKDLALIAAFDLRTEFGLRAGESISAMANGNNVEVVGKGGRFRSLPAVSQGQKQALAQLRSVSKEIGNVHGKLIPPQLSQQQMYDYQRNTIRAYDGTKANSCNMHVVRHDYAQREKAAGVSDKQLGDQLGHGRGKEVIPHYAK
ncbi:MAG: integrase domain-containing protein [Geobacteraceae bacterium]|nr:integrase domain-containing protein [Geobacteraceae bacterium]